MTDISPVSDRLKTLNGIKTFLSTGGTTVFIEINYFMIVFATLSMKSYQIE